MNRALIGYTGFIGKNLDRAGRFTHRFNSKNFRDMDGMAFDEVVCAGVSAKKWIANRDPDADRAAIRALTDVLGTVAARRFVLISTIDVYPDPSLALDEDFDLARVPNHPYGAHRFALEQWAATHFPNCLILRLPALFGPYLSKNALFDLLHDNQVDRIDPAAEYQWYPVTRIWDHLQIAQRAGLALVNIFTEPLPMRILVERFFPRAAIGRASGNAPRYRLRTRYAELFGGSNGYAMNAESILRDMAEFVASERVARQ